MIGVAATVVLFNPDDDVIDNLLSYAQQVDRLYVVDNSTKINDTLLNNIRRIPNTTYVSNNGNQGIASALNVGCSQSGIDGFDWVLTMDQDTKLPSDFIKSLSAYIPVDDQQAIGIVAPRYSGVNYKADQKIESVPWTMTSGNLLNLRAYETAGPFMNELFIDHVDHEYCLRLKAKGWQVLQANGIELLHRPGELITLKVFGYMIRFTEHSPLRLYYFCRNGFYVSGLYQVEFPLFARTFYNLMMKEVCKIPFQSKIFKRLKMLYWAYRDFKRGKLGPFNHQNS